MTRNSFLVIALSALTFASSASASAQSGTVNSLSAKSNIFLAGGNSGPTGIDGFAPYQISITAGGTGRVATFGASGSTTCGCLGTQGPDGGPTGNPDTNINSWGSIAGISGPGGMFLVGVFLGDQLPLVAPQRRSTSPSASYFNDILLGQVFFIGDGLTGTGTGNTQQFWIPDDATKLFLGFVDGGSFQGNPGAYSDNNGALVVNWEIQGTTPSTPVPEPASAGMVLVGGIALGFMRTRRPRNS